MTVDSALLARARDDVEVFARALVGEPLWAHQVAAARSTARIRVICSGRQAGKSRTLGLLAVHDAFRAPGRRVLILSAGEDAARELLREISGLVSSPLLAGSVVDDNASVVMLTNGSTIRSVPASEKQVRGRSVDLLVLDEAAFIDDALWNAARYTVIARPGSRVVMASTPWGRRDRFFATSFRAGRASAGHRQVAGYESFHWPSTVSPLVDRELLEMWRATSTDREYRTEVLAEWVDAQGAYFTPEELEGAVRDYPLVEPATAMGLPVSVGVDWGQSDASTVVLVGRMGPGHPAAASRGAVAGGDGGQGPLFVAWLDERFGAPYSEFIESVVALAAPGWGFRFGRVWSELNGVGAMPSEVLRRRLSESGSGEVVGVHTTAATKETGFGALKLLLQQGELVLPRHPELLRQLAALEYETLDGGSVRIAVPERAGHDDLAMGLMLALGQQVVEAQAWRASSGRALRYRIQTRRAGSPGAVMYSAGGESDPNHAAMRDCKAIVNAGGPMAEVAARRLGELRGAGPPAWRRGR